MGVTDPVTLLRHALGRRLRRCATLQTLLLYRWDLRNPAGSSSDTVAGYQISQIPGPDSPLFEALCTAFPERDFPTRLRQQQQCFVADGAGGIVGFAWVSHTALWIDEIELLYQVEPGEMFIYDCYVDASHRGKGIYPALINASVRHARDADAAPAVALIASMAWNAASIRGIGKTNFKECLRIRYLKLASLRKWWRMPAVRPDLGTVR
jgi:GNAT superfamily N-acetyltransferase